MVKTKSLQTHENVLLFSDGACSGNPGPGGWATVIATPAGEIFELGGGQNPTTNNRMELIGVIQGLNFLQRKPDLRVLPIDVLTDSTYVIRGITQWIWGWRKRGWKTAEGKEVVNQDLWEALSLAARDLKIEWKYVRGHSEIPGNERVDEIAVAFSKGQRPSLYSGPLLQYGIAIYDLPEKFDLPEMRERTAKTAAFSYLSLLNGKPARHSTWTECEARVKGRPGAKFKKAMSESDEKEILQSWGYSLKDL